MHDYAFDVELVRIAILLGLVVSMLFYERYGVTTGGAYVPGYLALFVVSPWNIAIMLSIAVTTYWIVQKKLRPRYMLWGRRLFEVEILVALALQTFWSAMLILLTSLSPELVILHSIGFLLPGIMAHDMGRQGVRPTIGAALITTFVVFGVTVLIGAVRDIIDLPLFLGDKVFRSYYWAGDEVYAFPLNMLWLAVAVSVLASITLYHRGLFQSGLFDNSLRSGGFITAGYLALFFFRPGDLLFVFAASAITYLIVTKILMKRALLFGRSKMAMMFVTGMLVTWILEVILVSGDLGLVPWRGFTAIVPTIVSLLANDAQRQGPVRTAVGVLTSMTVVFLLMWAVQYGWNLLV